MPNPVKSSHRVKITILQKIEIRSRLYCAKKCKRGIRILQLNRRLRWLLQGICLAAISWRVEEGKCRSRLELIQIFKSITADQLNEEVPGDVGATFFQRLLHTFDINKYPYLVKNLLKSPKIYFSKVKINHQQLWNRISPLMRAACCSHLKNVKKLISLGAKPEILGTKNRTAFRYSCYRVHIKVARYLVPFVNISEFTLL